MEPHLNTNDKELFYKYLDKSKSYFEFGSGGSTYQASKRKIPLIYSVESDKQWFEKTSKFDGVNSILVDLKTTNNWGYPSKDSPNSDWKKYSDSILDKKNIDLILIDGRFRVSCALKSLKSLSDDGVLIFDDFLNRPHYHTVLNYYDVIEKTSDNVMAVLKKKKDVDVDRGLKLSSVFELDPR